MQQFNHMHGNSWNLKFYFCSTCLFFSKQIKRFKQEEQLDSLTVATIIWEMLVNAISDSFFDLEMVVLVSPSLSTGVSSNYFLRYFLIGQRCGLL